MEAAEQQQDGATARVGDGDANDARLHQQSRSLDSRLARGGAEALRALATELAAWPGAPAPPDVLSASEMRRHYSRAGAELRRLADAADADAGLCGGAGFLMHRQPRDAVSAVLALLAPLLTGIAEKRVPLKLVPGGGGRYMTFAGTDALNGLATLMFGPYLDAWLARAHADACYAAKTAGMPPPPLADRVVFGKAELLVAFGDGEPQFGHRDSVRGRISLNVLVARMLAADATWLVPFSHLGGFRVRGADGDDVVRPPAGAVGLGDAPAGAFFHFQSGAVHGGAANTALMVRLFAFAQFVDRRGRPIYSGDGILSPDAGPLARAAHSETPRGDVPAFNAELALDPLPP